MSISVDLIQLAADEGKDIALTSAGNIQSALESVVEMGSKDERDAATFLLHSVNHGIGEILKGTLVEMARIEIARRI